MYDISFSSSVKKDIKKLDHPVKRMIKNEILSIIQENPEIGDCLVGDLSGVYSYHFECNRVNYRIAYVLKEKNLYVLMIAKRENFYGVLKRRLMDN